MPIHTITATMQFERAGNSPATWNSVANDLLLASQVLIERRDSPPRDQEDLSNLSRLGGVELMLRGMAVECLLKGVWVKQGNQIVKEGKFAKVAGAKDHDLCELAKAIGFTIDKFEEDVLARLSHFIYAGRYPIPKSSEKLKLKQDPLGGWGPPTTWSTPSDDQLFDGLVQRLTALLELASE